MSIPHCIHFSSRCFSSALLPSLCTTPERLGNAGNAADSSASASAPVPLLQQMMQAAAAAAQQQQQQPAPQIDQSQPAPIAEFVRAYC